MQYNQQPADLHGYNEDCENNLILDLVSISDVLLNSLDGPFQLQFKVPALISAYYPYD